MEIETLGKRLKRLRRHRDLSTSQLANLADCSVGLISKMETEQQNGCHTTYISKICHVLGCTTDWMIDGFGEDPTLEDGGRPAQILPAALLGKDIEGLALVEPIFHDGYHHYILVTESGYPVRLGDAVIINTQARMHTGDDMVAITDGQATYYRLLAHNGNMLQLENMITYEREMRQMSDFDTIGVVVGSVISNRIHYVSQAPVPVEP